MGALWRLNISKRESFLLVLTVLSALFVCHNAFAQNHPSKIRIFLDGEKKQHQPLPYNVEKVARQVEFTLKNDVYISYRSSVYQYLMERRGRIPVFSGMSGNIQLELGLSGYIGIKCRF